MGRVFSLIGPIRQLTVTPVSHATLRPCSLSHAHERGLPMAASPTGNVADLVSVAAFTAPGNPALIDPAAGKTLSWLQVDGAVNAFAAALLEAGLEAGDRVVVGLPAGARFCVALFAVLRAGG